MAGEVVRGLGLEPINKEGIKMMSLATINELAREQAARAAADNLEPLIIWDPEDIRHIPNFGDYRPEGWELVETYFVDKSGWGRPGEPALTLDEFLAKIVPGRAYALIEEGQFQVYVGEFVREGEDE
jgi:hypothetical protein